MPIKNLKLKKSPNQLKLLQLPLLLLQLQLLSINQKLQELTFQRYLLLQLPQSLKLPKKVQKKMPKLERNM